MKPNLEVEISLEDQLKENEAQHAKLLERIAQKAYQPFPAIVYKDIEKDGDCSHPSNYKKVLNEAELKAAILDGWRSHPEEAVAAVADKQHKPKSFVAHAVKSASKLLSRADREDDRADERAEQKAEDRAASKKKGK